MACRRSTVRARLAPLQRKAAFRAAFLVSRERDSNPLILDDALGRLAPELLEAVVLARFGREDVDDHVEVVHEDPARLAQALHAAGQQAVLLLHVLVDAVVDRLGLAVCAAGADDEVVRVAEHAAEVELDDFLRLDVGGVAGDQLGQPVRLNGAGLLARARAHATASARYRPALRMYASTASGTRKRIGRPAATRRRISEEEMSRRGMSKKRMRSAPARPARRSVISARRTPSRSATPSSARVSSASGSCQVGRAYAMSPPTMKVSSSSGCVP